jgi:hypothetical protein
MQEKIYNIRFCTVQVAQDRIGNARYCHYHLIQGKATNHIGKTLVSGATLIKNNINPKDDEGILSLLADYALDIIKRNIERGGSLPDTITVPEDYKRPANAEHEVIACIRPGETVQISVKRRIGFN